jgi:predicted GIY-YIG superfamily endonuclease
MASRTGTIYVGVSGDIETRVRQHKEGKIEGFFEKVQM